MTEDVCRERIRWFASHVGLNVFFIHPGELDNGHKLGAVFTLEDFDSDMESIDVENASDDAIRTAVEHARQGLADRCGCEIVHTGNGMFHCLRHNAECDVGEEQDPVIRQTLRWTACCPVGDITQAFYLPPRSLNEEK